MLERGRRGMVATFGIGVLLCVGGCNGDGGRPSATPTATVLLGATLPPSATATLGGTPTATPSLICPDDTATPTPAGPCTPLPTATPTGTRPRPTLTPTPGLAVLHVFDANPRYTAGVFLPLPEYTAESVQILTTAPWMNQSRRPAGAAADGATLLLIGVELANADDDAPVQLSIDTGSLPSGGLFAVDDQRPVDRSAEGGTIDILPDGPSDLMVDTVLVGETRWAFAIYRAPRDFDGASPLPNRSRPALLSASQDGQLLSATRFTLFRPLVIFLHGTGGDTSNWDHFALWRDSANELADYQDGVLPFYADRISFQWISLAGGHLTDNAATILPQIGRTLERWKTRIDTAATQADVVTHSYGGPTARQVAQTQPDPNPLTTADQTNFRAVTNWGHGLIRKLVTLAGSHRGSAVANSVAYLNQLRNGALRTALCIDGFDIAAGALADQIVLSPALGGLGETRLPGHAVVGSGTVQFADAPFVSSCFTQGECELCYPVSGYHAEFSLYRLQDMPNGPYQMAGDLGGSICGLSFYCENFNNASYVRLANYFFDLDYEPPFTFADCDLQNDNPGYDLTVSACSSRGQQPVDAYSTVADIDPALRGRLSHMQLLTNPAVSDRVRFLLHQPTTSEFFAPFAATGAPTPLEEQLMTVGAASELSTGSPCATGPDDSLINSCYNSCNSCEANSQTPPCFVEYRTVPERLVLRASGQAAPVFVYGRVTRGPLDGQWTNIQSLANQVWCSVTMTSSNDNVASVTTWKDISGAPDQSGINVVEAVNDGDTSITLTVQNNTGPSIGVSVIVDTTPAAEPE